MLAADKLLLRSTVKQKTIELREKELKLFNTNFSAVGTQAAIMAGFTLTSFVLALGAGARLATLRRLLLLASPLAYLRQIRVRVRVRYLGVAFCSLL